MTPRWQDVTAIFGGRFDPPHLGHREAVRGLFKNPGVKRVLILPTPRPAHKPCIASLDARMDMVRRNFESLPGDPMPGEIQIHDVELRLATKYPDRNTYTYDTLLELRREFQNLAMVIGTDQLSSLEQWHRFPEILGLAHWIVLARKPNGMNEGAQALQRLESLGVLKNGSSQTSITLVPTEARALSSTDIREEIGRTGQVPESLVFPGVSVYLKQSGLYGLARKI